MTDPIAAALGGVQPSALPPESAMAETSPRRPPITVVAKRIKPKPIAFDAKNPMPAARTFRSVFDVGEDPTLWHFQGDWYIWRGHAYAVMPEPTMRAQQYRWLDEGDAKPTRLAVGELNGALQAVSHLPAADPPFWIAPQTGDDPSDLLPVRNGLLHLPTRHLRAANPRLFATSALPLAYCASAPPPTRWLQFLAELWPDDGESVDALQELFGLTALTGDTRFQKAFLIVGPKRAGKGTLLRVLRALAGEDNTCAPVLAQLGERFGLQSLIGKRLAIISDARLSGRADVASIAETILRISGEDAVTVERKHLTDWTGKLPTRFVIASNELPSLQDASAALSSRFVVLRLTRSFYGAEDQALTDTLMGELPSILLWSMDGLDRLRRRGRLLQPASGKELANQLEDLASPVAVFVREECIVDATSSVQTAALYQRWREWCREVGRDHPGNDADFGRRLRAVLPAIGKARPRVGSTRELHYAGIRLRSFADES